MDGAEWRDIDLEARVVYVHRSFTKGRLKCPKTEASLRAVPLQSIALEAIDEQPPSRRSQLVFPAERGGYLDIPSPPSRSVPASLPSTSPATWARAANGADRVTLAVELASEEACSCHSTA